MNEYLVAYMDDMKNQFIMTERVFEDTPEAAKCGIDIGLTETSANSTCNITRKK